MKKLYSLGFAIGLLSGLGTLFGIIYLLRDSGLGAGSNYSIPIALISIILVTVVTPRIRKELLLAKKKSISSMITVIILMLSFLFPFIIWISLFQRAISNWTLF